MGKRQHQKDKPISDPVCNEQGYTFDRKHLLSFISKFNCDPITGNKPFTPKDVIEMKLHKNQDGKYHCPVLFKAFNENSKIVVIKKTGNVFSHEAIEELNIKTRNFRDLLTDEPFVRKDLIVIQDPLDVSKLNPSQYFHFQKNLKWQDDEDGDQGDDNKRSNIKKMDHVTKSALAELDATYKPSGSLSSAAANSSSSSGSTSKLDIYNAAIWSTGKVAASLTSTVMTTETKTEAETLSDETVRFSRVKKKGYVTIETNLGQLNLELYCHWCPKACSNFLGLARKGFYDGTIFHRSIRNFMIQGGDPTGTGTGGESIWGKPFEDEFHQHLSHDARGILSMANSGPNTNKSQFFITYRPCKHLDKKHTIFGRLVGGLDVLSAMERIAVDEKEKPTEDIIVTSVSIFVDPFKEVDEFLEAERSQLEQKSNTKDQVKPQLVVHRSGVGTFVDLKSISEQSKSKEDETNSPTGDSLTFGVQSHPAGSIVVQTSAETAAKKKKKANNHPSSFGNFNNW